MLSYQHVYHAGNHADVLKHVVLCHVLDYLNRKPKPWTYLDTHAGRGFYDLTSVAARKTGDAESGIYRLKNAQRIPPGLQRYMDIVDSSGDGYPGSPAIAAVFARIDDRLILCERHPADFRQLDEASVVFGRHVRCLEGDGYNAVRAWLPPLSRRGAILIDPSYELASDYTDVVDALKAGLTRFATGIFMIWYPHLSANDGRELARRLQSATDRPWLDIKLDVTDAQRANLFGSSVFVVNPPHVLATELEVLLPILVEYLGQDETAGFDLIQKH